MPNATAKGIGFLALLALACGGLLSATDRLTSERIDRNKHSHELRQIADLVGSQPTSEPRWVEDVWQLCNGVALIRAQTPGYGGPIAALVARRDGRLQGLRVTAHQETPGIADFVARPNDPWRQALRQRAPDQLGAVDAVAGATITSQALLALAVDALSKPAASPACGP